MTEPNSKTPAKPKPYCWAVAGRLHMHAGQFAESDARREAERCGGTCRAFPLYTAQAQSQEVAQ